MVDEPQIYSMKYYEKNPEFAIPLLSYYLYSGMLTVAIGAGASSGFGLPPWYLLVKRCVKEAKIKQRKLNIKIDENTENRQLLLSMDEVEKKIGGVLGRGESLEYRELVKKCLYKGVIYNEKKRNNELLISFSNLIVNSRRGSINKVYNFNFDDSLEWYLSRHGFDVQIIHEIHKPYKKADIKIYHPHGFLPKQMSSEEQSNFLIFSEFSYDLRRRDPNDPWLDHFESVLKENIVLFIGLSGDDITFGPALVSAKEDTEKERYTGFWFCKKNMKIEQFNFFKNRNIVPLIFNDFDEIPKYLSKICQFSLTL